MLRKQQALLFGIFWIFFPMNLYIFWLVESEDVKPMYTEDRLYFLCISPVSSWLHFGKNTCTYFFFFFFFFFFSKPRSSGSLFLFLFFVSLLLVLVYFLGRMFVLIFFFFFFFVSQNSSLLSPVYCFYFLIH